MLIHLLVFVNCREANLSITFRLRASLLFLKFGSAVFPGARILTEGFREFLHLLEAASDAPVCALCLLLLLLELFHDFPDFVLILFALLLFLFEEIKLITFASLAVVITITAGQQTEKH